MAGKPTAKSTREPKPAESKGASGPFFGRRARPFEVHCDAPGPSGRRLERRHTRWTFPEAAWARFLVYLASGGSGMDRIRGPKKNTSFFSGLVTICIDIGPEPKSLVQAALKVSFVGSMT